MIIKEKEEVKYLLTTLDRCDRCSAQAWVLIKGLNGQLYFCSHHYEKHENKLNEWAYEVIDERARLTEK
jgi:hypothetical protein